MNNGMQCVRAVGSAASHDDTTCIPTRNSSPETRTSQGVAKTGAAHWLRPVLIGLLLTALATMPYLNALGIGYLFDDGPDIADNPLVTGGVHLIGIFGSPMPPGNLYRPLTVLTFAINQALTPGRVALFHAVNVMLHVGVTLLVWAVALQLFRSARLALIAAALFAVHPIHTEAVTGLVGRAEVLAALWGLAALLSAGRAVNERAGWKRTLWEALSLSTFSLALLSKESAVTLLPLIPLYRVAIRREPWSEGLRRELRCLDWIPFALCAGLFVVLRCYVVWTTPESWYKLIALNNVLGFVPWTVRVRSALGVLWDYAGLLTLPLVLSADYSYNQVPVVRSWVDARFLAGFALVVVAMLVALRHRRPAVRFAAAFPFITLLVTSNILFPIGTVKAERLLYLPSVGWVLLAAYACDAALRAGRYRVAALATLLAVVTGYGVRTWIRNGDWRNDARFYRAMVRSAPYSAKAHYDYGISLIRRGDYKTALPELRESLAIYPTAGSALAIGSIFDDKGQVARAVDWYQRALTIEPGSSVAHAQLCAALVSARRFREAMRVCRDGLRYAPADPRLLKGLGFGLIGAGRPKAGTQLLRSALVLTGGHDEQLRRYLGEREARLPVSPSTEGRRR